MADDPRLSVQDRLNAKSAAWKKMHGGGGVGHTTPAPSTGGVSSRASLWEHRAEQLEQSLATNPFSDAYKGSSSVQPHKDDDKYGRPKEGSKTEYRGKQAGIRISGEIVELCDIIEQLGVPQKDGSVGVTFGHLFETYTRISNKLVGMLMRARKQNLVKFEGEMLYQRRDDDKIIYLIQRPEQLMAKIDQEKDALKQHDQSGQMK